MHTPAKEKSYLYTQTSQITDAGKGLFTAIDIYKDEVIAYFAGEIIDDAEASRRVGQGKDKYFMILPNGNVLDPMAVDCFAKYANDATGYPGGKFRNNAVITLDDDDNICLIALRKIRSGEEIFCSYGKKYWKKHR